MYHPSNLPGLERDENAAPAWTTPLSPEERNRIAELRAMQPMTRRPVDAGLYARGLVFFERFTRDGFECTDLTAAGWGLSRTAIDG